MTADLIMFNGTEIGDQAYETFAIERVRTRPEWRIDAPLGWSFCKTARKPYDLAVTAVLCYLATVAESHRVSSDGHGRDFLAGLELARQALPRYGSLLDIPWPVLEADRWCAPHIHLQSDRYRVRFCVDARAYVVDADTDVSYYRFISHHEAATWLAGHSEAGRHDGALFDATGWFDERRRAALARAQDRALDALVASGDRAPAALGRSLQPPAPVRPDQFPEAEKRPLTLAALLASCAGEPA